MGTLSVEEYFVLDDLGEVNSEYHDGEMFPIDDLNVCTESSAPTPRGDSLPVYAGPHAAPSVRRACA